MNHSPVDPDDLVRKKVDLNHITKMSYQMHVPDSITVGPNRSTMPRLHQDDGQLPVRMEVPNSIRLGNTDTIMGLSNGADFSPNNDSNHSLDSTSQPPMSDDDEYSPIEVSNDQNQPMRLAESWHVEPLTTIDDKNILNKLQSLQNRINQIERTFARRDFRDRIVYTCIIGYFFLQALLSVRRSMLN